MSAASFSQYLMSNLFSDEESLPEGDELGRLVDTLPGIVFVHGTDGTTHYANRAWHEHTGLTARSISHDEWRQTLHPEDLEPVRQRWSVAQEALAVFEAELRLRSVTGSHAWFLVRATPIRSTAGRVRGWLGSATNIDAQKRVLERLTSLQRMTAALAATTTPAEVVRAIMTEGVTELGATTAVVYRLDEAMQVLDAIDFHGWTPAMSQGWERVPLVTPAPICEAIRTRKAIYFSEKAEFETNYPFAQPTLSATRSRAWAMAPLLSNGRVIGALGFGFHTAQNFSADFVQGVELLSGQCALALDRAFASEAARRAAEALEHSRRNLEMLFNQLPSPVCRARGPELIVTFANGAFRSLIGSPVKVEGMPLREVVPTRDPFVRELVDRAVLTGEACTANEWSTPINVHDPADKRRRILNVLFEPTLDVAGKVDGLVIFANDVTQFVTARQQAEAAEKRLELALQSGRMFSWDWDLATHQMWRSEGHDRLVGIDRNHPDHDDPAALLKRIHPEDQQRVLQWSADAVNGTQDGRSEYRVVWPDGSIHWLLTQGEVLKDTSGKPYRMIGCTVDVTEQKETEFALQTAIRARDEQAAIIRTVAQNAASALYLLDEQGHPTFQNLAATHMTGRPLGELQSRPLHEALRLTHADGAPFPIEQEIGPGMSAVTPMRDQEALLVRKDGTRLPVSFSLLPIVHDGALTGAVLEVRDISEQKRTREALIEAIRARDSFFSMCSHELRTPLASLTLTLEVLRRQIERPGVATSPDQTPQKQIERLGTGIFKLSRLIDDMLDVARVRSGRLTVQKELCDLGLLVTDLLERFAGELEKAGCRLSVTLADGVVGLWDPHRIEQIAANLLTNAMRYAPNCAVDVTVAREGDAAILIVRDDGPGIAPEHHEEIFGQFMQVTSPRSTKGLGLGLYIVKQIVDLHGGTIRVDSQAGEGATFVVTLPLGERA